MTAVSTTTTTPAAAVAAAAAAAAAVAAAAAASAAAASAAAPAAASAAAAAAAAYRQTGVHYGLRLEGCLQFVWVDIKETVSASQQRQTETPQQQYTLLL